MSNASRADRAASFVLSMLFPRVVLARVDEVLPRACEPGLVYLSTGETNLRFEA
jgi:hypothetical protein